MKDSVQSSQGKTIQKNSEKDCETQTLRHKEKQTQRETEKQRDRELERQGNILRNREMDGERQCFTLDVSLSSFIFSFPLPLG